MYLCKKIILCIYINCIITSITVISQNEFFSHYTRYGTEYYNDVEQIPNGDYVIVGNKYLNSDYNRIITKISPDGTIKWHKELAESNRNQQGIAIKYTSYNKIFIAGNSDDEFSFNVLDSNGNMIIGKIIDLKTGNGSAPTSAFDIIESSDSNIYMAFNSYVVKLDSIGNIKFKKRIMFAQDLWFYYMPSPWIVHEFEAKSILQLSNDRFLVTGSAQKTTGFNNSNDILYICLNSNGEIIWVKTYGTDFSEILYKSFLIDDKIISVGDRVNQNSSPVTQNSFIFCTDTIGNQICYKQIEDLYLSGEGDLLNDSTIILVGTDYNYKTSIARFSKDGDFISGIKFNDTIFNANSIYIANSTITATSDGGYYLKSIDHYDTLNLQLKVNASLNPNCISYNSFSIPKPKELLLDELMLVNSTSNVPYSPESAISPQVVNLSYYDTLYCLDSCITNANFKPNKTTICINDSISFINNSLNSISNKWYINDTLISTTTNFSYPFTISGTYIIKLVSYGLNCSDSSLCQIHVESHPQSSFSVSNKNLKYWFKSQSHSSTDLLDWDFGDSSTNNSFYDTIASHNYKSKGDYLVCLKASNLCGSTQSCQTISPKMKNVHSFVKFYNENFSFYECSQYQNGLAKSSDGGYFIFGEDNYDYHGYITKINEAGIPEWTNMADFPLPFSTTQVTESYNGELIIVGTNGDDLRFGKMDSIGYLSYYLKIDGVNNDSYTKPIELKNNDIIFSGSRNNKGFLLQTDKALAIKWYKTYDGLRYINAIIKTNYGYLLVGQSTGINNIGIIKTNFSGDVLDVYSIDLGGYEIAYDIKLNNGNYFITGITDISGLYAAFILKMDSLLDVKWANAYSLSSASVGGHRGKTISFDKSNNIIVSSTGIGNNLGALFKTDSSGNILWSYHFDSFNQHPNNKVLTYEHIPTYDDGVALIGSYDHIMGAFDWGPVLIKLGPNETPLCAEISHPLQIDTLVPSYSITIDTYDTIIPPYYSSLASTYYSLTDSTICSSYYEALDPKFIFSEYCANSNIEFTDLSNGNITSWNWNFNGGSPSFSSLQNPIVNWSNAGAYPIDLTITSINDTLTFFDTIHIYNKPIVSAGLDVQICNGDTIQLNANGGTSYLWTPNMSLSNDTIFNPYAFPSNSTEYIVNISDGNPCVVSDTVIITVNDVDSSVTQTGNILISNQNSGIYQWVICPSIIPINGATNQSYTALNNDDYAVIVTNSGCTDTSACYTVSGLDLIENDIEDNVFIYPNPTNNTFYINKDVNENFTLKIYDYLGEIILEKKIKRDNTKIELNVANGIYFVEFLNLNTKKTIKLIIQK